MDRPMGPGVETKTKSYLATKAAAREQTAPSHGFAVAKINELTKV